MVSDQPDVKTAALAQADKFIADLLEMDVTSGEFGARASTGVPAGPQSEIGDSALLTGKFLEKNFVGDADNPAFKAMNEMRVLFEELDLGKEGDLMSPNKLLGMIPFGNHLQSYLRRYDSMSGSLRKLIDHIYGVQTNWHATIRNCSRP